MKRRHGALLAIGVAALGAAVLKGRGKGIGWWLRIPQMTANVMVAHARQWNRERESRKALAHLRKRVPSEFWSESLRSAGIMQLVDHFRYDPVTDRLTSDTIGYAFGREQAGMLLHYPTHVARRIEIGESCRSSMSYANDGVCVMAIDGVRIRLETPETLGTLVEIFAKGVYDFKSACPVVVWDVGMNVGAASLRFAGLEAVKKIVSFEPFPGTYAEALRNFALNEALAAKIVAVPKGVAAKAGSLVAFYSQDHSAGNTTVEPERKRTGREQPVELELLGAESALDLVKAEAGGLPILLKLDAEGAEYEILMALDSAGRLADLSAITMEYHKGPEPIIPLLQNAGFDRITSVAHPHSGGFIRASKAPLSCAFDHCTD